MSDLAAYLDAVNPGGSPANANATRENAGLWDELRSAGVLRYGAALVATHLSETVLLLVSWVCIGSGALSGRLDYGWMAAWALALAGTVPLHALSLWLQGIVAIGFGGVLKQRLLEGALSTDPDVIRAKGAGELLSEVTETVALDDLASNGGVAALLAIIELVVAPLLLFLSVNSRLELGILLGWEILTAASIGRNLRLRLAWTRQRLALTNQMVENMVAQRTRVVQQSAAEWHTEEDVCIDRYLGISRLLDDSTAMIETALPRSYIVISFVALAPSFLSGATTLDQLAITVGIILYAKQAFEKLCFGFSRPATALVAWLTAKPMSVATKSDASSLQMDLQSATVLQARDIAFTYPGHGHPVLTKCSISMQRGDHVLLEGASGSGKSTLAAILAGDLSPSGGFVLAAGLDLHTLGDTAWRRHIALAPQYHENYLFTAPLIYNLLLSSLAPNERDIAEAEELCRELGLGAVLDRMPDGIHQVVGDMGWRLSQGERSRIFLARALLQRADLLILDESFAALDPYNVRQCLECVRRRAPNLIVTAQP